ncbi:MAG: N-acetylmuramoyl-L-alanine amidase [Clostridia bacterium]|nr:N-acetylmuramoyl-L-alanine amidase [Clostridia bacterium]
MFIFIFSFVYYGISVNSTSKSNGIVIVIDAGHGARDGGSVGQLGTIEKDINLKYALKLKEKLTSAGYIVQMTRKTDDPLYLKDASNKKQSDMKARMKIIKNANPNLLISIHMNSFSDKSVSGANTFYRKGDESGKQVSDLIQMSLKKYCEAKNSKGKVGDYYILNESYYTAVLIECGFLSNMEEERLLNTNEYLDKFTNAVCSGIMLYFGIGNGV